MRRPGVSGTSSGPSPVAPVSNRGALIERPHESAREPEAHIFEGAIKILVHHSETTFARLILLHNAIQLRLAPGLVARSRAQRSLAHREPVRSEGLGYRAAVSLAPKSRFEKLLNCASIPGVEIDREDAGGPLHFSAPIVEEVGVLDEHARQVSRISLGQQVI